MMIFQSEAPSFSYGALKPPEIVTDMIHESEARRSFSNGALKSPEIVTDMIYESEARRSFSDVALNSPEIVTDMIYENEAPSFSNGALKSPEIVTDMIDESEARRSFSNGDLKSPEIVTDMIYESEARRSFSEVALNSPEIVTDMIDESEARKSFSNGALKPSEIVIDIIYESEAQSFNDVALKSQETVSDMIYENEARSIVDVASKSPEIIHEDSRISYPRELLFSLSEEADNCKKLPTGDDESPFRVVRFSYTREQLLSLADGTACKELPCGFDQSIISELQDACNRAPGIFEASIREPPERWDRGKLTTADGAYKSAHEIQKFQGYEPHSIGRSYGISAEEFAKRWDIAKLISADVKATDSEKFNGQQFRRPLMNPTAMGIIRNTPENSEQSRTLGSWSAMKSLPDGSEMSTSKFPGSDSLLSRCSQPYRPPSYYKSLAEAQKQELPSNKAFGHAEVPSKQRATEERWIKDDLKTNERVILTEEKQKSSGLDEVIPTSGVCRPLEEHSALQVVNRFRVSPPVISSVFASVESPCPSPKETENCHTEDSLNNQPLSGDQPLLESQEMPYLVEKLQAPILEGGRFSALSILEDAEEVDPDLINEANLAFNDKPRDDQTRKKQSRINNFQNKVAAGKAAFRSSDTRASMRPAVPAKPFYKTFNSQGGFVDRKQKGVSFENFNKGFSKKATVADKSVTEAAKVVSNGSFQHQDIKIDSKNNSKHDSGSGHRLSDNDETRSNFSLWSDLSFNNLWRPSIRMPTEEDFLNTVRSFYTQEFGHAFGEATTKSHDPLSCSDDEADDSNYEIMLPDEDSLITIDDTYILVEETTTDHQSPPNNVPLKQTDTTSHQNQFLQTDQWVNDSHLNLAKIFAHPSHIQSDFRGPSPYIDPWRSNHINHSLFPDTQVSYRQPPAMPRAYEPPFQDFQGFFPHLDNVNTVIPDVPLSYCQAVQKPNPANVNSSYTGARGRHGEQVTRPTFSQIIKMQIPTA